MYVKCINVNCQIISSYPNDVSEKKINSLMFFVQNKHYNRIYNRLDKQDISH